MSAEDTPLKYVCDIESEYRRGFTVSRKDMHYLLRVARAATVQYDKQQVFMLSNGKREAAELDAATLELMNAVANLSETKQ